MKRVLMVLCAVLGCAVACGKTGVFTNERFACVSSGDCADGYECRADECRRSVEVDAGAEDAGLEDAGAVDAGLPDGGGVDGGQIDAGPGDGGATDGGAGIAAGLACQNTPACQSGLTCVDGLCCRTACNAPCDSCNQAGNLGTCLPRPAGAIAPSCNGYACTGSSSACGTTCSADGGLNVCNPTFTCLAPACSRCWTGVTDDFSLAVDPAFTLGMTTVAGGHLVVSVQASNGGQPKRNAATSIETLPLTNCGLTFELVVPPLADAGTGYVGAAELFTDTVARQPSFGWRFDNRGLLAAWSFADGGVGEQLLVAAGTTPPRWLRLEESGGEVRWRSTNTTSFTTLHSVAHAENVNALKLEFSGTYPPQPPVTTVFEIDNLNLGP